MKLRIIKLLFITIIFSLLLVGCMEESTQTASDLDIELPYGLSSVFPFPAEASVTMVSDQDDSRYVGMFSPGITYPEFLEFYSTELTKNGWTIYEEYIPEDVEGEREASWHASGHGVKVRVSITAFGGIEGSNMNAFFTITPLDEQSTESVEEQSEGNIFPDNFPSHLPYPDDYIELRSANVSDDTVRQDATYYTLSLRFSGDMEKLEELTDLYIDFFENNNYERSMGQVGLGTFYNFIYERDGERVDISINYRENHKDVLFDMSISIEE